MAAAAACGNPKTPTHAQAQLIGSTKMETDRLSALPDKALHRVLSHLLSVEAARTVALSRRWRHIYQGVPVVDLVDPKTGSRYGSDTAICFDQQVTSAVLCKTSTTPIQTFRLSVLYAPRDLLDQWIMTALSSGVEELDVKLRYNMSSMHTLCPFGRSRYASADFVDSDKYMFIKTPRQIFRNCATLRRLRLTNWTLDLPRQPGVFMAYLESLFLARIMDPEGLLQQLVSSCPLLVHLTLEECPSAVEITVASAHLQSFAMICCHNARAVALHSRRLRSLRYRGGAPDQSLFKVTNHEGVVALTIEICQELPSKVSRARREIGAFTTLITRCTGLTCLHLSLLPSMANYISLLTPAVRRRCLPRLRQLGLHGRLRSDRALRSVAVLLRHATNLEALSVFLPGAPKETMLSPYDIDFESDAERSEEDGDDHGVDPSSRVIDGLWRMSIECLDHTLTRISIVNYRGRQLEQMLAKFLLSKGAALEEFSVTMAAGCSGKREVAKELKLWRSNRRTRVRCKPLH